MHLLSSVLGKPALYLDPGSGSFILQVLLAALLGGGFAIKAYWKNIKKIFVKSSPEESDEEEETDEDSK
ncbi:hypothetical protein ADM99_09190 [Leptolinea tardivitalis]|uniref:Uncharacterized protein n=2 Tax=Leptolinea tardivitalis TaxID=229920 RepID=A0A0P6WSJ1_9CHLR|nr:hypothetical protein ADM99_09190 [Leptolinea tardivitalis]